MNSNTTTVERREEREKGKAEKWSVLSVRSPIKNRGTFVECGLASLGAWRTTKGDHEGAGV